MKTKENIQKIREAVAQWLYEAYIKGITDHSRVKCVTWDALLPTLKEQWYKKAEAKLPELDKLGVVVLAEDQTPKACPISSEEAADALYNQDNQSYHWARTAYLEAQSDMSDFKRVVSIVTGTPKEG
jgi:hypothetical protein